MISAVDIETSCGVKTCPGFDSSNSTQCKHAVHFKQNKIDIIGVYDGVDYHNFKTTSEFDNWRRDSKSEIVGHGFKFDYKTLKAHGSTITPREIVGDTQILGSAVNVKVPSGFLRTYNEKRKELNATLPPGQRHRTGTPLTLKTMAPYYIGVPAFWENTASHNDTAYNNLDCVYTYRLHEKLLGVAAEDGVLEFYRDKLIPWSKLLAEAEYEGILVDEVLLHKMYAEAIIQSKKLSEEISRDVEKSFKPYYEQKIREITRESDIKCDNFIVARIKDNSKIDGTRARYAESLTKNIAKLDTTFNLNSPEQVKYLLLYHGVDMEVEKRDKETNEWIKKEGTDKFVLKRAKVRTGLPLVAKLLKLREQVTEVNYLKQYIGSVIDGRIYCSFNGTGTRTGRLSSSGPNLQNVKGSLKAPFIVADAKKYSIYCVDSSQIEPRLAAYLTGDPEMVKLFQDGRDYHNYATKKFFPEVTKSCLESDIKKTHERLRKTAKIGDLSILYGTGHYTFQTMCLVREEMDIPLDECKVMVQTFRAGMKGVLGWKKNLEENYKAGIPIRSFMGRIVQARDEASVHMTLFNSYAQGLGSDMIVNASLLSFRHFVRHKVDAKPLIWVHDEVIWRFPKGKEAWCKEVVDYHMKHYKLDTKHGRVPLDVEGKVDSCWVK